MARVSDEDLRDARALLREAADYMYPGPNHASPSHGYDPGQCAGCEWERKQDNMRARLRAAVGDSHA